VKKQQNSHKIILLPLGNKKGEIEQGNTDQGIVPTLKSITAGSCMPKEFLTRSQRRREAMEVSRKTYGVRGDKIQALKERIEAGEYRVEPEAVAEKLLEHAICELARGILPSHASGFHQSRDQRGKPVSL
jgi:anti-sigma28 factor (negative regulator of flagellin synthesis)